MLGGIRVVFDCIADSMNDSAETSFVENSVDGSKGGGDYAGSTQDHEDELEVTNCTLQVDSDKPYWCCDAPGSGGEKFLKLRIEACTLRIEACKLFGALGKCR